MSLAAFLAMASLSATAQVTTTVDFVVSAATPISTGTGGDEITFVSGAIATSAVGGCGLGGAFPVQDAIVVKGGTPMPVTVIVTSSLYEISSGTRLGSLSFLGECAVGTVVYHGYRGAIQ